jgi:hypothetical protein
MPQPEAPVAANQETPARYTVVVAYSAAAAQSLPDAWAAVVHGTRSEIDTLLERIRAENPGGDAKAIRYVELDVAEAFEKIMFPF